MESKKIKLRTAEGKLIDVTLKIGYYGYGGRLYVGITSWEGEYPEPYADLTVNLRDGNAGEFEAYIDTNNEPWAEDFIKENKLGEYLGVKERSGFCEYPLYKFDRKRLEELCPEDIKNYTQTDRMAK